MKRLLFVAALLSCINVAALAHGLYDPWCCSDKDCAPIPDQSVEEIDGGWKVTLNKGDHPMVTKPMEYFVKKGQEKFHHHGGTHACFYPDEETLRCLYVPPPGS